MTSDPFGTPGGTGEIQRDQYGRYKLPDPVTGKPRVWTRATTWADTIAERFALNQWGGRMAAKGLAMRPDLLALAAATPLTDSATLNKLVEQAKEAAGAKEKANLGTAVHGFTEKVDQGGSLDDVPEPWRGDVQAYAEAMNGSGYEVDPQYVERVCVVPELGVAGTFDRLLFESRTQIKTPKVYTTGDLKTGANVHYAWGEIAVQLSLYAHATHLWDPVKGEYSPMPEVRQDVAIVMHLPVGSRKCTLYEIDIEAGWEAAKLCGVVREYRKNKKLAVPFLEHVAGAEFIDWAQRIREASSRDDLSAIWQQATTRGEWTEALEKLGQAQLVRFPS